MESPGFDSKEIIEVQLRTPEGTKVVPVRFPTDEEWIERQRRRKALVKQLGRGASETTFPNGEEVDADLVARIRTDPAPEIDVFEAARVLEQISQVEVDDVVPEGDAFRVTLRVPGVITSHLMRTPSQKDVIEYRRGFARVIELQYGRQEVRINIAPAGPLYKKLLVSNEGYASEVPIIHQTVAVKAAIDALENAFAEDRDANFRKG